MAIAQNRTMKVGTEKMVVPTIEIGKMADFEIFKRKLIEIANEKIQNYLTDFTDYDLPELELANSKKEKTKYVWIARRSGSWLFRFDEFDDVKIPDICGDAESFTMQYIIDNLQDLGKPENLRNTMYLLDLENYEILQIPNTEEALMAFATFIKFLSFDMTDRHNEEIEKIQNKAIMLLNKNEVFAMRWGLTKGLTVEQLTKIANFKVLLKAEGISNISECIWQITDRTVMGLSEDEVYKF